MAAKKLKLTIELVPASSWNTSLRSALKPHMWDKIRKATYKRFGEKCAICQGQGKLHAHEEWQYDDKKHIQYLRRIIALCIKCHAVKHFGHTELQESKGKQKKEGIISHFIRVNNCTREDFEKHRRKAYELFEKRSRHDWLIDLSKYRR